MYSSLIDFRTYKNLSQFQMAKKMGVSLSFYSKVELGIRNPSRNFICKLKTAFPEFDANVFFNNKSHVMCRKRGD